MARVPAWMGYIAVDDVDEAANRLKQEGGKVVRGPIDVPGIIRFAVVADPQGAAFMIAKATPPQNRAAALAHRHARHHRLARALRR